MDGIEIKKRRKSLGLTQEKLAKMIGVSKKTIVNYEGGSIIPESKKDILLVVLKKADFDIEDYSEDHNGKLHYLPWSKFNNNLKKNDLLKFSTEILNQIENYKKAIDSLHEIRKNFLAQIEMMEIIEEQEEIWKDSINAKEDDLSSST